MASYSRILVGTDGSDDAQAAVHLGAAIALKSQVPLTVIVAYDGDAGRDQTWATALLTNAAAVAQQVGASDITTEAKCGEGSDVLVEAADKYPDGLLVVGSSGLSSSASRILGSTSNRLSHHSKADVLFARSPLPKVWHFVALATDGTPTSLHAVRNGIGLARVLGATPRLVTAARSTESGADTLQGTLAALQEEGLDAGLETEMIVNTDPAKGIISKAWKWELLVIGNKSMSGVGRFLGSTANKVSHGAETNLLLVNTTRS